MSLDLYIISETPTKRRGTGIFVRDNGTTRELSYEEAKERYPNAEIVESEMESPKVWSGNITHNLSRMAEQVDLGKYNLYQLLWTPETLNYEHPLGDDGKLRDAIYLTEEYREMIYEAIKLLIKNRKELEKYNPENGWGDYEGLLNLVTNFGKELSKLDIDNKYIIYAWV